MKQTVYTASPESQQIHVWSLEADGKLTLVQVVDAPGRSSRWWSAPTRNFCTLAFVRSFACWPIASRRITGR